MDQQSLQNQVEIRIGEVVTHPKFVRRAEYLVEKKLGAMLYTAGEVEEIAADAISDSVVKLLGSIKLGTSSLKFEEASQPIPDDVLSHAVSKYIQLAVNNYCKTRLHRWSLDQKQDKKDYEPDEDMVEDGDQDQHQKQPKKAGVRSRYEIHSEKGDDADFWDQHVAKPHDDAHLDTPKVVGMLADKGLKKKEIDRILLYLGGMTCTDMARDFGGVEGTYRHSIRNSLEKVGLEDLYTG